MRWLMGLGFVFTLAVACNGGVAETGLPPREDGTPTAVPTANSVRATVLGTTPYSAHDSSRSAIFVVVRFEPPLDDLASVDAELLRGETGELIGRLALEADERVPCVGLLGAGDVVFAFRGEKAAQLIADNLLSSSPGLQMRLNIAEGAHEPLLLDLPIPTCFVTE
ncbi:MAG: hypothetical protein IIB85_04335 [Chloroflexi bacterium]|nr:hypothetical protein [Chloroflexota bacterium]